MKFLEYKTLIKSLECPSLTNEEFIIIYKLIKALPNEQKLEYKKSNR